MRSLLHQDKNGHCFLKTDQGVFYAGNKVSSAIAAQYDLKNLKSSRKLVQSDIGLFVEHTDNNLTNYLSIVIYRSKPPTDVPEDCWPLNPDWGDDYTHNDTQIYPKPQEPLVNSSEKYIGWICPLCMHGLPRSVEWCDHKNSIKFLK